jgi:carbonic anhydrase
VSGEAETKSSDLLGAASEHAKSFSASDAPAVPRTGVAIVTCMDARIDPAAVFGLAPGDAHVIRNAGGIVTDDVIRSLTLSQALLETREILVVQHTRCGVNAREEELRDRVAAATGAEPPPHLGGFQDLEESVRTSLQRLGSTAELPAGRNARGFVYDVDTGELREISR